MDVETGLICAGVCVLSGVVVYFISIFGIRQRTFESAVEEQLTKSKEKCEFGVEKSPRKEKKYKKYGRKHKDKDDKGTSIKNELLDNAGHLDGQDRFVENFEVLESSLNNQNSSLANEDDSDSCDRHKEAMELKHRGVCRDLPRTDADNYSFGEEDSLNTEDAMDSKSKDMKTQTVASHFIMQTTLDESVKQQVENLENGVEKEVVMTSERLLHMLENISLTDEENQMLIDVLANKQSGNSEWTTVQKNDPVATLKRQLADREKQLDIEQTRAEAANAKMLELKEELGREKSHLMTVEKSLQEKVTQLERENKTLKFNIQQSCEQHQEETSLLQLEIEQMQSNLQGEQALIIKKLQEENDQLKDALANSEAAKHSHFTEEISKLEENVEQLRAQEVMLQQEQDGYATKIQYLEEHNGQLVLFQRELENKYTQSQQQITDLTNQVEETVKARLELNQELERSKTALCNRDNDCCSLTQQLEESSQLLKVRDQELTHLQQHLEETERVKCNTESELHALRNDVSDLMNKQNDLMNEIDRLRQEKEILSSSASLAKEDEPVQGAEKHNGDISFEDIKGDQENISGFAQYEKIVNKKEEIVQKLQDDMNFFRGQLNDVREELDCQRRKNNELREKNWKIVEALAESERYTDKKLLESEKEIDRIKKEARLETEKKIQETEKKFQEKLVQIEKEVEERSFWRYQEDQKSQDSSDRDKMIGEDTFIQLLQEQIDSCKNQINLLVEEIEEQKSKNNVLQERNWKITEALREAEKYTKKVKEAEEEKMRELEDQIKCVKEDVALHQQVDKQRMCENVEVKSQNDREEDILKELDKCKSECLSLQKEGTIRLQEEQKRLKQVIQKVFPQLNVSSEMDFDNWLQALQEAALARFADQDLLEKESLETPGQDQLYVEASEHQNRIKILENNLEATGNKLAETVKAKIALEKEAKHYRSLLVQVEEFLAKLQEHAAKEEESWTERLAAKDKEIEKKLNNSLTEEHLKTKQLLHRIFPTVNVNDQLEELIKSLEEIKVKEVDYWKGKLANKEEEITKWLDIKLQEEQQKTKELLTSIFPTVTVEDQLDYASWCSQFKVGVLKVLEQLYFTEATHSPEECLKKDARLAEMTAQLAGAGEYSRKLELETDHYKTALTRTEEMLVSLQETAAREEEIWRGVAASVKLEYEEKMKCQVRENQQKIMELLKTLFPAINLDHEMDFCQWLSCIESEVLKLLDEIQVRATSTATELLKEQIVKLEEEKRTLASEVEQCKNSLLEKEESVNKLRSEVEVEEQTWRDKFVTQEKELKEEFMMLVRQEQKKVMELLKEVFPSVVIDDETDFCQWLMSFRTEMDKILNCLQSRSSNQETELLQEEIVKLEEEKNVSLSQAEHYKNALSEMEDSFRKMKREAETEEQLWREKFNTMEEGLKEALKEKEKLTGEKVTLETNLLQLQGIEEANKDATDLQDQLHSRLKEVEELKKDKERCNELRKELESVRLNFEKEQKKTQDLSSQVVQLSEMVKVGQETVKAEKELVQELQAQVEALKKSSTAEYPLQPAATPSMQVQLRPKANKKGKTRKSKRKQGISGKKVPFS
ncbi:uncharacterized protein LOC143226688 isoform X4 [Tachypleus tridentatus]|uniref:uncharacterized protein LOC143226688 isoform X4 n=1 Tax=Tachypleus tridentatus TaxID=6853 RepID=UPI003FD38141